MPDIVEYTPSNGTTLVKGGSSLRRISGTLYATDLNSASGLVVGSGAVLPDRVRLPVQSGANPGTPTGGDFWFRGDTGKLNYYDGAQVQEIGQSSGGGGIPDPGTKVSGDMIQYDGTQWVPRGASSGSPVGGAGGILFVKSLTLMNALQVGTTTNMLDNLRFYPDNTRSIGEVLGSGRPYAIYLGTEVDVASGSQRFRADRISLKSNGSGDPTSKAVGDFWFQYSGAVSSGGRLRYQDTAVTRQVADGLHGKTYNSASWATANETTIITYYWSAGELDTARSILRFYATFYATATATYDLKIYKTTNGGGAWTLLTTFSSSSDTYHVLDFRISQDLLNSAYVIMENPDTVGGWGPAFQRINTGTANWLGGSSNQYGIRYTITETGINTPTVYCKAWLFEERVF